MKTPLGWGKERLGAKEINFHFLDSTASPRGKDLFSARALLCQWENHSSDEHAGPQQGCCSGQPCNSLNKAGPINTRY